jgi:hypothetical protein
MLIFEEMRKDCIALGDVHLKPFKELTGHAPVSPSFNLDDFVEIYMEIEAVYGIGEKTTAIEDARKAIEKYRNRLTKIGINSETKSLHARFHKKRHVLYISIPKTDVVASKLKEALRDDVSAPAKKDILETFAKVEKELFRSLGRDVGRIVFDNALKRAEKGIFEGPNDLILPLEKPEDGAEQLATEKIYNCFVKNKKSITEILSEEKATLLLSNILVGMGKNYVHPANVPA